MVQMNYLLAEKPVKWAPALFNTAYATKTKKCPTSFNLIIQNPTVTLVGFI